MSSEPQSQSLESRAQSIVWIAALDRWIARSHHGSCAGSLDRAGSLTCFGVDCTHLSPQDVFHNGGEQC